MLSRGQSVKSSSSRNNGAPSEGSRISTLQRQVDDLQASVHMKDVGWAEASMETDQLRSKYLEMQRQLAASEIKAIGLSKSLATITAEMKCTSEKLGTSEAERLSTDAQLVALRAKSAAVSDRLSAIGRLSRKKPSGNHAKALQITTVVAAVIALRLSAPRTTTWLIATAKKALILIAQIIKLLSGPAKQLASTSAVATYNAILQRMQTRPPLQSTPPEEIPTEDPAPAALICAPPPALMPSAESGGLMLSAKYTRDAILYDGGCTTLMTNNQAGLIGALRKVNAESFATATGAASFDTVGTFERTMYGSNGQSISWTAEWHYNPKVPFDVVGPGPLRKTHDLIYHDASSKDTQPYIELRTEKKSLGLLRTDNGLEWLSYAVPRRNIVAAFPIASPDSAANTQPLSAPATDARQEATSEAMPVGAKAEHCASTGRLRGQSADKGLPVKPEEKRAVQVAPSESPAGDSPISSFSASLHDGIADSPMQLSNITDLGSCEQQVDLICVAMPLDSSGVGMGNLHGALTDLQKAILDHVRRGHCSIKRAGLSSFQTTGGFKLTKEALQQLAVDGCDVCNAYKIKLVNPKKKPVENETDEQAGAVSLVVYDQFGKVEVASAVDGFHYAHIYAVPAKNMAWLLGSKRNDAHTISELWKQMEASFAAWFPNEKCRCLRMDSYSSNLSGLMLQTLRDGMTHPEFSPPGDHAHLTDAERYWYPVVMRALIVMRHGKAPMNMWFRAMLHALDVECTLASRIDSSKSHESGYMRCFDVKSIDVSDIYCWYAPGRFAIDPGQLDGKWVERARAGFWVGRDVNMVMKQKTGFGVWWDGYKFRTVHKRFYVQEGSFLKLTAPNNKLLPNFPLDAAPIPAAVPAPTPVTTPIITAGDASIPPAAIIPAPPPPPVAPLSQPISLTRPSRANTTRTYNDDSRYDTLFTAAGECTTCDAELDDVGCCTSCNTLAGWKQLDLISAVNTVAPSVRAPCADIVLNLCCGSYDNTEGISAKLRAHGIGVLDADSDPIYGGGADAHLLANATFSFFLALVRCNRVAGVIESQPCGSGSVKRFDITGDGNQPEPSRDQHYPDGKTGLDKTYQKEIHDAELLSYRITTICRQAFANGAWVISEVPSTRGDASNAVTYDPAFSAHASVKCGRYWKQLRADIGAVVVSIATCSLRDGYPQKLEDFTLSPNLPELAITLSALQCKHPPGSHANSFAGVEHGKWSVKSSQTWIPELCDVLVAGVLPHTIKGGPSFKLGRDDIPEFVTDILRWNDAEQLSILKPALPHVDTQTAAIICNIDADYSIGLDEPYFSGADIDPMLDTADKWYIDTSFGQAKLTPSPRANIASEIDGFCMLIDSDVASKWIAPQTETALRACPEQLIWIAADQVEIDKLWNIPVFHEVLESNIPEAKRRYWRTKFVRRVKTDPINSKVDTRSRLVCMGTGHEEGREYDRKDVPTPMWATVLLLIGECTVAQGIDFQFDLSQFFQQTDCSTPDGTLYFIPPPRYQRKESGVRVLWAGDKWLQGAMGAGHAARAEFKTLLTTNSQLRFSISNWDPSLFYFNSDSGAKIRFCLHGDDGSGGWATHQRLIDTLGSILETKYGTIKLGPWNIILGFEVKRNRQAGTTKVTATKYIQSLERLVSNDVRFSPKLPYTKEISELEVGPDTTPGTPEHSESIKDAEWMRSANGSLQYVSNVRVDVKPAVNMNSRYSHRPSKEAILSTKHTIMYLLSTPDVGLTFGSSPDTTWKDLIWHEELNSEFQFNLTMKILQYHMACDGALGLERSISGIVHMFAGACINGLSFRQHSIAISAYDSEMFTASSASAMCTPFRGILTELMIIQRFGTPCFVDSSSTILCSESRAALKKSIYLMRRALYLQEQVDHGNFKCIKVAGDQNFADPFTKAITVIKTFFAHRRYYMGE